MNVRPWLVAGFLVVAASPQVTCRSTVELVRVDVSVTRDGAPVAGLGIDDFEVRDNGRLQPLDNVIHENVPLDPYLLFDTSESVAGEEFVREIAVR